jgi:hypothetical protein
LPCTPQNPLCSGYLVALNKISYRHGFQKSSITKIAHRHLPKRNQRRVPTLVRKASAATERLNYLLTPFIPQIEVEFNLQFQRVAQVSDDILALSLSQSDVSLAGQRYVSLDKIKGGQKLLAPNYALSMRRLAQTYSIT